MLGRYEYINYKLYTVKNDAAAEIVNIVSTYTKINNEVRCIYIGDFNIKFCKGRLQTLAKAYNDDFRLYN